MRKTVLYMALAIIFICIGCADKSTDNSILGIQDIQKDPLAFTGTLKINGVASAFSEDDATYFAVMDTNELFACKNLYCGAYALPVQYIGSGSLPELADLIDMVGSFVKTDTGYYFEVTDIEVKSNIRQRLTNTEWGAE